MVSLYGRCGIVVRGKCVILIGYMLCHCDVNVVSF